MHRSHTARSSRTVNAVLLNEASQDGVSPGQRLSSPRSLCEATGGVPGTLPIFTMVSISSQPVMCLPDGSRAKMFVPQE